MPKFTPSHYLQYQAQPVHKQWMLPLKTQKTIHWLVCTSTRPYPSLVKPVLYLRESRLFSPTGPQAQIPPDTHGNPPPPLSALRQPSKASQARNVIKGYHALPRRWEEEQQPPPPSGPPLHGTHSGAHSPWLPTYTHPRSSRRNKPYTARGGCMEQATTAQPLHRGSIFRAPRFSVTIRFSVMSVDMLADESTLKLGSTGPATTMTTYP
ncbi:MAG: hypothetical protein M1815_003675 [Lichina confinis]|nr:MAG: hypothetical protein M1815_003675 [Lichina confinis]